MKEFGLNVERRINPLPITEGIPRLIIDLSQRWPDELELFEDRVRYNRKTKTAFVDGEERTLGEKQHLLLMLLYRKRGQIVTPNEVNNQIWPHNPPSNPDRLNALFKQLRKKLEPDPRNPSLIHIHKERYWLGDLDKEKNKNIALLGESIIYFPDINILERDKKTYLVIGKEHDVLMELLSSPNTPLSIEYLKERVWPGEDIEDITLQSKIHNLRKKAEPDFRSPRVIKSEKGVGYWYAREVTQ